MSLIVEYPADSLGRGEWSTALGIVIDGAGYTLQGEPPPAKGGNWFKDGVQH